MTGNAEIHLFETLLERLRTMELPIISRNCTDSTFIMAAIWLFNWLECVNKPCVTPPIRWQQ